MTTKYLYDYLSAAVPDVIQVLDVTPTTIDETFSKSQRRIGGDDLSEIVYSFSDSPILTATMRWDVRNASDSGIIFDFWLDSNKANGAANKFIWTHPHDGYNYVARMSSNISRGIMMPGLFQPSDLALHVIGYIESGYYLNFDNKTGGFTAGNIIYGVTSEASATIEAADNINDRLLLTDIIGTFQDDEIIYETSYSDEILTDPNIELWVGDDPDYWGDYGSPTVVKESSTVQSGSYSLKFTVNSEYDGVQTALPAGELELTPGCFYISSFYIYGDGTNGVLARFVMVNGGTSYEYFSDMGAGDDYIPAASWTQHSLIFYNENGTSGGLQIIGDTGENTGTHYVDTTSLKKITNAALVNGTLTSL